MYTTGHQGRTQLAFGGSALRVFAMAGDAAWGAGGLYFSSWDARDGSYESYYDVDQGLGT